MTQARTVSEPRAVSALFAAVADWASERGHRGDGKSILAFDGPEGLTVRVNTSKEEQDSLPPFSMIIENGGFLPVAMCDPYSGVVMQIGEDRLIEIFTEETS